MEGLGSADPLSCSLCKIGAAREEPNQLSRRPDRCLILGKTSFFDAAAAAALKPTTGRVEQSLSVKIDQFVTFVTNKSIAFSLFSE